MNQEIITATRIQEFCQHLELEEKSQATVSKYDRDVKAFVRFLADSPFTKEIVIAYKKHLVCQNYATNSINSMLASLNCFLDFF